MAVSVLQCIENQPTLICTCSGTAIIPLQPNTVWWTYYTTEPELCVLPAATERRRRPSKEGPNWKKVPHMGTKQGENEDQGTPKQHQNKRQKHQCQCYTGQQEILHSTPICKRAEWNPEKCLQKTWDTSTLKEGNTIKSLLMAPKDKDPITKKSGIIYRFKCNRVECDDEYIGESSRKYGEVQGTPEGPHPNIWPLQHHRS